MQDTLSNKRSIRSRRHEFNCWKTNDFGRMRTPRIRHTCWGALGIENRDHERKALILLHRDRIRRD
jgi:hypothetical protein